MQSDFCGHFSGGKNVLYEMEVWIDLINKQELFFFFLSSLFHSVVSLYNSFFILVANYTAAVHCSKLALFFLAASKSSQCAQ